MRRVRTRLLSKTEKMERAVSTGDSCSKRLSTITEYSEPGIDSDDNEERYEEEPAIPRGDSGQRLEDQASTAVKYFLVDDSPMAKFSRSIKWIYKKVSLESTSVREHFCTFLSFGLSLSRESNRSATFALCICIWLLRWALAIGLRRVEDL